MKRFLWWTFCTEDDFNNLKDRFEREIKLAQDKKGSLDKNRKSHYLRESTWLDGYCSGLRIAKNCVNLVEKDLK